MPAHCKFTSFDEFRPGPVAFNNVWLRVGIKLRSVEFKIGCIKFWGEGHIVIEEDMNRKKDNVLVRYNILEVVGNKAG